MPERIDELFYDVKAHTADAEKRLKAAKNLFEDLGFASGAAGDAAERMGKKTDDAGKETEDAGKRAKGAKSNFLEMAKAMGLVVAAAAAVRTGIGRVRAGIRQTIVETRRYDTAMTQVSTLTSDTGAVFAELEDRVVSMSRSLPKTADDLGFGLYQTLSSGITDTSDALVTLEASGKLAAAGLLDTLTSVDATTTVMNAYGLGAERAEHVTDLFFRTVERGKITVPELAQNIGNVATLAGLAEVPLEDLSAAISTMTTRGFNAATTMTSLSRFLEAVLSPTPELSQAMQDLGVDFSAAALRAKGLQGFMEDLRMATDGNVDVLANLGFGIRESRALFVLAGNGAKDFAENLTAMETAAGSTDRAVQKVNESLDGQLQILRNRLNSRLLELGQTVLPIVIGAFERLDSLIFGRDFDEFSDGVLNAQRSIAALEIELQTVTRSLDREAAGDSRDALRQRVSDRIDELGREGREVLAELQRIDADIARNRAAAEVGGFRGGEEQRLLNLQALAEGRLSRIQAEISGREEITKALDNEESILSRLADLEQERTDAMRERSAAAAAAAGNDRAALQQLGFEGGSGTGSTDGSSGGGLSAQRRLEIAQRLREAQEGIADANERSQRAAERAFADVKEAIDAEFAGMTAVAEITDETASMRRDMLEDARAFADEFERLGMEEPFEGFLDGLRLGRNIFDQLADRQKRIEESARRDAEAREDAAEADREKTRELEEQRRQHEAIGRAMIDAAEAAGIISSELAAALNSAMNLVQGLASGNPAQAVAGIAGLLGSIFSAGEARERRMRQAMEDLEDALHDLRKAVQPGTSLQAGDVDAFTQFFLERYLPEHNRGGRTILQLTRDEEALLARLSDALGFDVFQNLRATGGGSYGDILELLELLNNGGLNLSSAAGAMELFRLQVEQLDLESATEQLELFTRTVLDEFAPGLSSALSGFDLSTSAGVNSADAFIRDIAEEFFTQGITDRIAGLFGTTDAGSITEILSNIDAFLDRLGEGGTEFGVSEDQDFVRNVQITQAQSGRLLALETSQLTRLEQLVDINERQLSVFETLLPAAVSGVVNAGPDTVARHEGLRVDNINVQIGGSPPAGESVENVAKRVGSAIVDELDRQLASNATRARRTAGKN